MHIEYKRKGYMKKNIVKNIILLYGFSIAKIIFPLMTLPYLTRVLNVNTYGVVSYVKNIMIYIQIVIDFGFMLSGTKEIVEVRDDKKKLGKIAGDILFARILLSIIVLIILIILCAILPILKAYTGYTLISFVSVFLSIFLFDYVFRGIEEMQVITLRFVIMKGIATAFTFILVKNDSDIFWIPILDCIGSAVAVIMVFIELKKRNITIGFTSLKEVINKLIESAIYFTSDMATTAFGALNTVLIGAFLSATDVAYWDLCMSIVSAVQALYSPINNGIYPDMVKSKDFNVIKKSLKIFMPIIIFGCIFTFIIAKYALLILGGSQYTKGADLLRSLTPVLLFSFPSMLLGWPTLGAIGKVKEVTFTTIITAIIQIIGLVALIILHQFNLVLIALLRGGTELFMLICRSILCNKYKTEFKIY